MTGRAEQTNSSLIMVGTVHRDPKGYRRLYRYLEKEKPNLVSVEVSPYARAFRAHHGPKFRAVLRKNLQRIAKEENRPLRDMISHSAIMGVFLLLREPFEWRAAEVYGKRNGIRVWEVDLSFYSQQKLSYLPELISLPNLRTLLRLPGHPVSQQVDSLYNRARHLFSHPPSLWPVVPEIKEREAFMAEQIRRFVHGTKGKKVLHVGGWEHLIASPKEKSLFGLLLDFHPTRILLSAVAN